MFLKDPTFYIFVSFFQPRQVKFSISLQSQVFSIRKMALDFLPRLICGLFGKLIFSGFLMNFMVKVMVVFSGYPILSNDFELMQDY